MVIDELIAVLGYDIQGEADLKRFNSGLDNAAAGLTRFASIAGAAAAAAGAALTAGLGFLGKAVISTNAQFEALETTLVTIEGSTEKARQSLDWVAEFAQKTPYDLKQVGEAFVRLRAYGLDPTTGLLESLGDASSAMGKDLMAAVEMIADASTGEFERLKEFGLRASQAGDQVTFSWTENGKDLTKTVKKSGAEITGFIREQFGNRFSGAMIRQSKTWNGMISNLGDSWTRFLYKIGQAGFFEVAKNKLGDLMDAVNRFSTSGAAQKLSDALSKTFSAAVDVFSVVIERAVRHFTFLSENIEKVKPYLTALGVAMGALFAWTFPVVTAFALAGLAVEDFLTWLEGGDSIIGQFIEWVKKLPEAFGSINWQDIGRLMARAIIDGLSMVWGMISDGATTFDWSSTGLTIANGIWSGLKALGNYLLGFWSEMGNAAATAISSAISAAVPEWAKNLLAGGGEGVVSSYSGSNDNGKVNLDLDNARLARRAGLGPSPGKVADDLDIGVSNARSNMAKMNAANATQSIENTVNDSRNQSVTVQVGGVTVQGVQNVTPQVGAAVGQAVGSASANAATPPARLVGGGL